MKKNSLYKEERERKKDTPKKSEKHTARGNPTSLLLQTGHKGGTGTVQSLGERDRA